ncbi:hypothetical protein SDC9_55182 [bioreactor metagenome]|uniref:Uncharacterized protein n=1 Tax=bioreactor metagenome TaxID=1076179 RepID=A0A644WY79_9ZZZZ
MFDKIFPLKPIKFFIDWCQVLFNLLFIDFNVFNAIDKIKQLFFTDIESAWNHFAFKLFSDHAFKIAHLAGFAGMKQRNRNTFAPRTTSSSTAMDISFQLIRQIVIDHMGQIIHVEPTCCNISCNKQLQMTNAETVHYKIALCLRQIAMQCICIVAILNEFVGNLFCFSPRAAKNDSVNFRIDVDYSFKRNISVFRVCHIILMRYIFGTHIPLAY